MLIKSNKMFVDIFNIHTCKCKNIRVYLSSYCALRNWLFLHTYASSKKTLHCSEVESKAVLNLHFFPNFHSCKCFVKKMIPWIQCRTRKGETKSKFGKKKILEKKILVKMHSLNRKYNHGPTLSKLHKIYQKRIKKNYLY